MRRRRQRTPLTLLFILYIALAAIPAPLLAQLTVTHTKVSAAPTTPDPNDIDSGDWNANHTLAGILGVASGGTGANLSATGGANQLVRQNSVGGVFTVSALAAADIPSLDTSKVTTGTFASARISEASVTQHQAALALAASQITSGSFGDARIDNLNTLATGLTINRCVEVDGSGFLTIAAGACATSVGSGIQSLNGLTVTTQTFAVGTSGSDLAWSSAAGVHTLNAPSASGSARGPLTSADWTTFNSKQAGDADLTAIAALSGTGIPAQTGAGTWALRSIVSAGTTVTITNPLGVAGNIDLAVNQSALTLSSLGGAVTDAQVPHLNVLSTGLTANRCVETDSGGSLVSASALCGSGSGGTPGGSDTHIQYNSSGSFAGSARLTWSNSSSRLTLGDGGTVNASIELNPSGATYNPVLSAFDGGFQFNATGTTYWYSQEATQRIAVTSNDTATPIFDFYRDRLGGPVADGAVLTQLRWSAVNSASSSETAALISVTLDDADDGTEDATTVTSIMVAGALTARLTLNATGADFSGILSVAAVPVALSDITVGAGNCISGGGDLTAPLTLDLDMTECGSLVRSNGASASFTDTYAVTGTDVVVTYSADLAAYSSIVSAKEFQSGDGLTAGDLQAYELAANGANFWSWTVADALTATVRLRLPNASPADSVMLLGTPAGNISEVSLVGVSGTGSFVRATSATLTTPVIASIVNTGTLTLPTSTDTLVGKATTDVFTNKTLDFEGTGNVITGPTFHAFEFVGCSGTTATVLWNTLAALAPTGGCSAGSTNTNMMRGILDFPDSDGDYSVQRSFSLPPDWTGVLDVRFGWKAAATSGDAVWQFQWACIADAEVEDVAWSTASTVTDTAKGTTLQENDASIIGITLTGCAASEQFYGRILRNRTHASDSITGVISLLNKGGFTFRRAM